MKELNMSKIITGYSLVLGVLLIAIFNFLIPGNSKAFTENITEINAFTENLGANKDIAFDKAVSAVSSAVVTEINDGNASDSLNLS